MRPIFLSFLLALAALASFAEPFNIPITGSSVQNLISVSWENTSGAYLPGYTYRSSFTVLWAIPNSALRNIDAKQVDIYITASAPENSTIAFAGAQLPSQRQTSFSLTCFVQNGACSPNSTLSKKTEFTLTPPTSQQQVSELISINASLSQQEILSPNSILSSLASANYSHLPNLPTINLSDNGTLGKIGAFGSQLAAGIASNSSEKNAAHQNAPSQPASLSFLLQNPLVSLVAFALVVIVTGAYLLKNRD